MNGTKTSNGAGAYTGGIPLNVTLHGWPVPKLQPEHKQYNQTNPMNIRNSESAKNFTNRLHNLNATGYVAIDEDLTETGFTDVQTLILAGIATLIPLFIGVAVILGIRFLWRRYRQRKGEGYEGVLQRDESSQPLGKFEGRNLPLELKSSESQFSVTAGGELTNGSSPQVLTPKSNGSVITMTLKNNHLIVETEETNVSDDQLNEIKVESQGTTTKYVTPTAPEFKMDVPSLGRGELQISSTLETDGISISPRDDGALIHYPPKESEEELDRASCNTGLSQSDLSVSSAESQNPSYRYGNQTGYDSGGYGYPEYSGYATFLDGKSNPNAMGPGEYKNYYKSPSLLERTDSVTVPGIQGDRQSDILRSDITARANRLREAEEDKRYQEEQRALGNGDVSPKKASQADGTDEEKKSEPDRQTKGDSAANMDGKGAVRSFPSVTNGSKGSRCEQLKKEISPAEEVECYPNSIVNSAAGGSVHS